MIFLKDYQRKVIHELDEYYKTISIRKEAYLSLLNSLDGEQRELIQDTDWVQATFMDRSLPYQDSSKNGLGDFYPRIVIKVPTAGGKTLLAVEAIRSYQQLFAKRRTGLVVWIVPTEAIYSQTIERIRNKGSFLRQLLDQASGNRTVIVEKGQTLTTDDIENNLVIMFLMIQSISRRTNKEALRVFQDSGGFESFFPPENRYDLHAKLQEICPNIDYITPANSTWPLVKTSLGNAIRVSRPLIIIDEIHKVFSELARNTIDNLNPEMVLGLSATPKANMNIVVSISGAELKAEEMVKLDMHIFPPENPENNDWKIMLEQIISKRQQLEEVSSKYRQKTGVFIRPIALIQVEATGLTQRGKGRVHSHDVKEELVNLGVNADEIALKTSSENEIKGVDLLSSDCQLRFIITKEALREGWDCPFAYILGVIPNVNSDTGITQLIGRILRQPNAIKTKVKSLDESYVFYTKGGTGELIGRVVQGFQNEGLEDLIMNVQIDNASVSPESKTINIKEDIRKDYAESLYLPVWLMIDDDNSKRLFSYEIDIRSRLNFTDFILDEAFLKLVEDSLSSERSDHKEIIFTLDEESKTSYQSGSVTNLSFISLNISYLTRRYAEVLRNAFMARRLAEIHIRQLQERFGLEQLSQNFSFLLSQLVAELSKERASQEEHTFGKLLEEKKLVLAVSNSPEMGYKVPDTDTIIESRLRNPFSYYLFDDVELGSMNSLERKVGEILDKQDRIVWWFRNKVAKGWYSVPGWKKNRIKPDFIAAKKSSGNEGIDVVYILESKGEHLVGNMDTEYKKSVLDTITTTNQTSGCITLKQLDMFEDVQINDNFEAYLIEQGTEEAEIRSMFSE